MMMDVMQTNRLWTWIGLLFLIGSSCLPTSAYAVSAQELKSRLQKKVFFIRGFYIDDHLVYDGQGKVEGHPQSGPWSVAALHIDEIRTHRDKILLEGTRAVAVTDPGNQKFLETIPPNADHIEIEVESALDSLSDSDLDQLLDRIFLSKVTVQDVPEWWHDFFEGTKKNPEDFKPGAAIPGMESEGQPVFRPANGVSGFTPPKLLAHTEPEYVEIARKAKLQGTTVLNMVANKEGIPEQIQVTRPLGIGLDDSAVQTVQKWRFSPATKNGEPVPVWVSVEVTFRLR